MHWLKIIFNKKIEINTLFTVFKKKVDLDKLHLEFNYWASITEEATSIAIQNIDTLMTEKNISLEKALELDEGKNIMFQLLLHKHWVGYHSELLRQLNSKLLPDVDFWNYSEKIENKISKKEINLLLNQFIEETKPYFKERIEVI